MNIHGAVGKGHGLEKEGAMEQYRGNPVLWPRLKLQARVFEASSGHWGVRPGAIVWYATARQGSVDTDVSTSVDTGETRPTYKEIVEWLEIKTRQAVGEALGLTKQERNELVINPEIEIDP